MSTNHDQTVDAATAALANKATGVGAGAAVFGWLASSELSWVAGVVIGLAGLLVNWYYKHKENKRQDEAHRARMKSLEDKQ